MNFNDFCESMYIAEEGISDWIHKRKEKKQESKRQQSLSGYEDVIPFITSVANSVASVMKTKTDDAIVQSKPMKISEDDETFLMITVAVQGADEASLDYKKIISEAKAECGSDLHSKKISVNVEEDQYGKYVSVKCKV